MNPVDLRWLDTVFQGQYLPSLSINYDAINKDFEKLPPQMYQIKIKICYDQGCNDIGVVIAMKRRYYQFYLQQYISALGIFLPKSFTGAFSSNSGLDVLLICESVIELFWGEVLMVRNTVKNGKSWCLAGICMKQSAFDMQFHIKVVSIVLENVCERSWR